MQNQQGIFVSCFLPYFDMCADEEGKCSFRICLLIILQDLNGIHEEMVSSDGTSVRPVRLHLSGGVEHQNRIAKMWYIS